MILKKLRWLKTASLKNDRIRFTVANVSDYEITPMDGFLLSDVLHYLTYEQQENLLTKCFSNLKPGGCVLIREANAELAGRHEKSLLTEFFSTHIGFNKTQTGEKRLYFTSAGQIRALANEYGLTMEVIDNKKVTSNNLFVVRKQHA